MRKSILSVSVAVLAVLLFLQSGLSFASVPEDVNLKLKSTDIYVFKNGIDFVLKSGRVKGFNGTAVTDDTPDALMGSMITYVDDKDAKIKGVTSYKESMDTENDVASFEALLKENVGKTVKVGYGTEKEVVTGTLKMASADFIIVKKSEENVFIERHNIKKLSILDEIDTKVSSSKQVPRLKFDIESKSNDLGISLGYLRRGIRWIPLYKVDLLDNGEALITLDAQIVNDGEDAAYANFYLIVGAPNFKYSNELNPFVLKNAADMAMWGTINANLRNDIQSLSNAYMSQTAGMGNVVRSEPPPAGYGDSQFSSVKNEDTFVYEVKGLSLNKGERMIVNLFSAKVKYEDIYKLEVADNFTSSSGSQRNADYSSSVLMGAENKVWHNLRLNNTTSYPWTTGIATVFKSGTPISQDMMRYTARGTDFDLPLMVSSDIYVLEKGNEVSRERIKMPSSYSDYYDKVSVKAIIRVTSAKDKPVKLEIKKSFYGDDVYADSFADVIKSPFNLTRINPKVELKWSFLLKEKKEKELGYGFTTLIRR